MLMEKARSTPAPAPEGMSGLGPNNWIQGSINLCHQKVPSAAAWHRPYMKTRAISLWHASADRTGAIIMLFDLLFAWVTGTLLGLVSRGRGPSFTGCGPFLPSDWWLLLVPSTAPVRLPAAAVSFISPLEQQHSRGAGTPVAARRACICMPSTGEPRVCQLTRGLRTRPG